MTDKLSETPATAGVSDEKLARIAEVMRLVSADAESDALALDGKPFSGRTVAQNFGNLYAQVQALANAVEVLADRERDFTYVPSGPSAGVLVDGERE